MRIFFLGLLSTLSLSAAVWLAQAGTDGWGWFLFISVIAMGNLLHQSLNNN